jgi:hypothetical protein
MQGEWWLSLWCPEIQQSSGQPSRETIGHKFSADDDVVFRVLFSFFVRLRITVDVPKLCNSFYWNRLHFR